MMMKRIIWGFSLLAICGTANAQFPTVENRIAQSSMADSPLPCVSNICLGGDMLQYKQTVQWVNFSKRLQKKIDYIFEKGVGCTVRINYIPKSDASYLIKVSSKSKKEDDDCSPLTLDQVRTLDQTRPEKFKQGLRKSVFGGPYEWLGKYVKNLSSADKNVLALYWNLHMDLRLTDTTLLNILSNKPLFCRAPGVFSATFLSESGYITEVYFVLSVDGKYIVTRIERQYTNLDDTEWEQLKQKLLQQYPYLNTDQSLFNEPNMSWGEAHLDVFDRKLIFALGNYASPSNEDLSHQPDCATDIKVD